MADRGVSTGRPLLPIAEVAAERLGLDPGQLIPYGHDKAKLPLELLESLADRPDGQLILVTAMTPTPAGDGKTTTAIGLADGLSRLGERAVVCLREPAQGPCFGMKGGGAGGGRAQVAPMADINLHFTGDFHAITSAHNLLAALVDNHLHFDNALGLDPRRIAWRRVLDVNDRALRDIVCGLGGPLNGLPREGAFDITVASEIMAVLCLSTSLADLKARLGRMIVGYRRGDRTPVFASDVRAAGAMTALLRDALQPNLVQTLEGTPALVHGGPFANIAHGCNSALATRAGLKLADYVITEAGFGADLGAEKFIDIKCRKTGLRPALAVVVVTIRALKYQGGQPREDLTTEDLPALRAGVVNLRRHLDNLRDLFGLPVVVAINHITSDTAAEVQLVHDEVAALGATAVVARHWAEGGAGAEALAREVLATLAGPPAQPRLLYDDALPLWEKLEAIATRVYGAGEVTAEPRVRDEIARFEADYGHYPICVAKTQYSFSADPDQRGAPTGHTLPVREVRLARGAEFLVAVCGSMMTMPGLPRSPAAEQIDVDESGQITGLF